MRIVDESTYEGGYHHYLRGDKLETDEQEAFREKLEKDREKQQLDYQRKQYEALKAKFEKNQ